MKLNPFNKKANAYYSQVKTAYDQLDRELRSAQARLKEAETDHERKRRRYDELSQQGSMFSSTTEQRKASFAASEAANMVTHIKGNVGQLESEIRPLRRIALAPEQFAQAQRNLDEHLQQHREANRERERVEGLIGKVSERVAAAEARLAAETQAATRMLLDGEAEFSVPESLGKAEAELRLGKTSLADLQAQREALTSKLSELPKALREAERIFVACRAVMAEIELYEHLMPVMNQFARASVARGQTDYHRDLRHFEIDIPQALLDSAEAELVAEVPTV